MGTDNRLWMLTIWCERMEILATERYSLETGDLDSRWMRFLHKVGLASALSTFILGWDEVEFPKIVDWLKNLERNVIIGDRRRVLRIFFWQFLFSDNSKASWQFVVSSSCLSSSCLSPTQ